MGSRRTRFSILCPSLALLCPLAGTLLACSRPAVHNLEASASYQVFDGRASLRLEARVEPAQGQIVLFSVDGGATFDSRRVDGIGVAHALFDVDTLTPPVAIVVQAGDLVKQVARPPVALETNGCRPETPTHKVQAEGGQPLLYAWSASCKIRLLGARNAPEIDPDVLSPQELLDLPVDHFTFPRGSGPPRTTKRSLAFVDVDGKPGKLLYTVEHLVGDPRSAAVDALAKLLQAERVPAPPGDTALSVFVPTGPTTVVGDPPRTARELDFIARWTPVGPKRRVGTCHFGPAGDVEVALETQDLEVALVSTRDGTEVARGVIRGRKAPCATFASVKDKVHLALPTEHVAAWVRSQLPALRAQAAR